MQTSKQAKQLEGQEQVSPDSDNNGYHTKPAALTHQNLALFNKMEGTQASMFRSLDEATTTTISTISSGFVKKAHQNGILDPYNSKPPTNIDEICRQYARSRTTPPPTQKEHRGYARIIERAKNKASIFMKASQTLLKEENPEEDYMKVYDEPLTAFPANVGFNNGLSTPKPNFIEGLTAHKFNPFPIETIKGAILYQDDPFPVILPHIAGEWKARGKNMATAEWQVAYNGAAFVYARNQALSYLGKPDLPGHAEVRTFTSDGEIINFYAHYAAPSADDGKLKYHQYRYASVNVSSYIRRL